MIVSCSPAFKLKQFIYWSAENQSATNLTGEPCNHPKWQTYHYFFFLLNLRISCFSVFLHPFKSNIFVFWTKIRHLKTPRSYDGIFYTIFWLITIQAINLLIETTAVTTQPAWGCMLVVSNCATVPLYSVFFVSSLKLVSCQHEVLWHHISRLVNLMLTLLKFIHWFHCPARTLIIHEWASSKWSTCPQGWVYKC